jgi:hypothetical protein
MNRFVLWFIKNWLWRHALIVTRAQIPSPRFVWSIDCARYLHTLKHRYPKLSISVIVTILSDIAITRSISSKMASNGWIQETILNQPFKASSCERIWKLVSLL